MIQFGVVYWSTSWSIKFLQPLLGRISIGRLLCQYNITIENHNKTCKAHFKRMHQKQYWNSLFRSFIVGFAASWGPVVWTVCAEVYPLRERGKATGLTTMTNWFWTTIVGALFPLASSASLTGCFAFFAGTICLGSLMVYFLMAETARKTILEIDEAYANHKPKLVRKKW